MTNKMITEYFPHDSNAKDDPKIMLMMAQLGIEAYGIYWILVEYLRQQPGYRAPLMLLDSLSRRYGSSREKFEAVISKFGLFESDENSFYSPSLNRRMEPLDTKREKMRNNINIRWTNHRKAIQQYNNGNTKVIQSRVEKSREEYSKVKKSRVKKSISSPSDFSYVDNSFSPAWMKWFSYKIELGDPYKTVSGAKGQYNHLLSISGGDPVLAMKIVDQSIAGEWKGLFPVKISPGLITPGEDPIEKGLKGVKAAREARLKRETEETLRDIEYETMLDNIKNGDKD